MSVAVKPAWRGRLGWIAFAPGIESVNVLLVYFVFAPYATTIVVSDSVFGQTLWGVIGAVSASAVAALAPMIGQYADRRGARKQILGRTVAISSLACALLWFAVPQSPPALVALTAVAVSTAIISTQISGMLYGSILPTLAPARSMGRLSGAGMATGVASSLVLLAFYHFAFAVSEPPWLGLDRAVHEHSRISGPIAATMLAIFSLPLLALTPDEPRRDITFHLVPTVRRLAADVISAFRAQPNISQFIIARTLYGDGLGVALAFGSIYAASLFGWDTQTLLPFGMSVLAASAVGAFAGGFLGDRIGLKRTIVIALCGTLAAMVGMLSVQPTESGAEDFSTISEQIFLLFAIFLGFTIGPTQASSQAILAQLVPPEERGRWFGIMTLTGNVGGIVGPLLVAIATAISGSQRVGLMAAPVLIIIGLTVLAGVRPRKVETSLSAGSHTAFS